MLKQKFLTELPFNFCYNLFFSSSHDKKKDGMR